MHKKVIFPQAILLVLLKFNYIPLNNDNLSQKQMQCIVVHSVFSNDKILLLVHKSFFLRIYSSFSECAHFPRSSDKAHAFLPNEGK